MSEKHSEDKMNESHSTYKFVKFGIKGIDDLFRPVKGEVEYGIPRGSSVVLSGDMGTGKTTFLMQFLKQGIKEGEKGILVSLEESPYNIMRDYCHWEFDGGTLIDVLRNGRLTVFDGTSLVQEVPLSKQTERVIEQYYPQYKNNAQKITKEILKKWEKNMEPDLGGVFHITEAHESQGIPEMITNTLRKMTALAEESDKVISEKKDFRVCVDSLTSLLSHGIGEASERDPPTTERQLRKTIIELRAILEVSNATTLFTAEARPAESTESEFTTTWKNIEHFVARGVIQLGYHGYGKGDLVRYLRIIKMRGVGHSTTKYAFEITNKEIEWIGELIL
ncbi:MAG: ATPase domain-containing protein [Candidatus Methanofastidiosia archaeon]